ncbi:MAG: transketolase [Planctomycetota bacterium]|nr:transketolase [Planctomycetota bacterium]
MADKATMERLRDKVYEYRKDILQLCYKAKGMHVGGDLSCAEVIVTLYEYVMRIDPQNPSWEDRDRFVISKGHGGAALYLVMAMRGYFGKEELLATYKGHETRFGMHPCKTLCPELDSSSGSLGHGLPIATGMALAGRLNKKSYRTFCMVGDGEMMEGAIWEAAMAAAHYKLGSLIVILDRNRLCLDGFTEEIMGVEPVAGKWQAFGWNAIVIDGNNLKEVMDVFDHLPVPESGVPTAIISQTVKGKGVSFMENNPAYHHAVINDEQFRQAIEEIEAAYQQTKGGAKA